MKKGFTLMELMIVIVILGVIGTGAIVAFANIDKDTTNAELENKYKEIQRASLTYLDLNDSWLEQFSNNKEIYIILSELKNSNYVNQDLTNPVTGEEINNDYYVKIFVDNKNDFEYVNSCIVSIGENKTDCIANNKGKSPCNYESECK